MLQELPVINLLQLGYKRGAPSLQAAEIDAQVATAYPCRKCGGFMRYEPYYTERSYIAFAVCAKCGNRVEF